LRVRKITDYQSIYQPVVAGRSRTLPVRGIEYYVNEWGDVDAPLFLYLHGWADTGSTFQFVVDSLATDWRVVAPDWRGFGRTVHRSESYWFPDYLADLHEILNHYSPEAPARLVGHSMGGNVASLYAGTMPERVSAVVNIEGFGLLDSDPEDAPQRYRSWLEANQDGPVFSTYSSFESLADRIRKRSPDLGTAEAIFVARQWASEDGELVRLRADPNHKLPNPVLYRRAEAEACWRNISARMLLIAGDRSPFATQFGKIDELPFPNSHTATLPGVGHMIHFEAPDRLALEIEQFLKKPL
jgi:pimeloyl-ACP methyl ester carboxylesterase